MRTMTTGEKIRKARRQALLTQAELAALAGIGPNTIGRIERGKVEPHLRTIRLLAAALDVPPSSLVSDEEPLARAAYVTRSLSADS